MHHPVLACLGLLLAIAVCTAPAGGAQRIVRVSQASLKVAEGSRDAVAVVTVDNGTMYDVYVVGVATDAAGLAELRQAVRGDKPAILKEAMVPAFGQLDMSAEGIHIYLAELKRPLKPGETVNLSLTLDNGEALMAAAVVK
jgi:copper(I)-binding protein